MAKIFCDVTGRELTVAETFVQAGVDGEYTRDQNDESDDWRPVGRENAGVLRDKGFQISGIITPQ